MNNNKILISIILFTLLSLQSVYSQQKYEKESRIKTEEVPVAALDFIDALHIDRKIRWYSEIGLDSKSVEAKFKKSKTRYSIEFDTTGSIQDAELEINWIDIKPLAKATIVTHLGDICTKYKARKIQIQYTGSEADLLTFLEKNKSTDRLTTKYELVVKCKNKNKVDLFEYLFSNEGELIETSKIVFKNSSNLEY